MDGLTVSQLKINGEEEEEGNSVIESHENLNLLNTNIDSLPDEIVFDILGRIPAQDIYCALWPVCLKWYQLIRTRKFAYTHLQRSTYGLLIQSKEQQKTRLTFMQLSRQGRIELTRLTYEPQHKIWCSSCNGLILESECNKHYFDLYITNPVTMQHFSLPPTPPPFYGMSYLYSALAYASLSMEYKVVRVYCYEYQWCCAILTAGVDESWRSVRTQHLALETSELRFKPLTTEGFVHWPIRDSYVLTLNVETEIITEYPIPSSCSGDGFGYNLYYFSTVKHLSMLVACQSCWGWLCEVWEMEPGTGDWTKLPGIELKDRQCEILGRLAKHNRIFRSVNSDSCWLIPVGWLEYKEVLVYLVSGPNILEEPSICIAWNIRLKKPEFIELDSNRNAFIDHRNSLMWLDGC